MIKKLFFRYLRVLSTIAYALVMFTSMIGVPIVAFVFTIVINKINLFIGLLAALIAIYLGFAMLEAATYFIEKGWIY